MIIKFGRRDAFSSTARPSSFFGSWKPLALLLMVPVLHFLFSEVPFAIAEAGSVQTQQPLDSYFESVGGNVDRKIGR